MELVIPPALTSPCTPLALDHWEEAVHGWELAVQQAALSLALALRTALYMVSLAAVRHTWR